MFKIITDRAFGYYIGDNVNGNYLLPVYIDMR